MFKTLCSPVGGQSFYLLKFHFTIVKTPVVCYNDSIYGYVFMPYLRKDGFAP